MTAGIVASVADLAEHPAARAWAAVGGGGVVRSIARLAKEHHCLVYRLDTGPEPSQSVIAKWGDREFHFNIDKKFQKEILPSAGLPSLAIYGEVVERDKPSFWMFFEDGGDQVPQPSHENRCLLAQWLATLHAWSPRAAGEWRDSGPGRYLGHLHTARQRIVEHLQRPSPWLTDGNRADLHDLSRQLDLLQRQWEQVESACAPAPKTVVHGDLVGKNIRRRDRSDTRELLVFDWQTAGIGAPCVDLAQRIFGSLSPDLECFREEVRPFWPAVSRDYLERLAAIGTVFRVLAALDWESQSLSHPGCWLEDLLLYGPMLADAVQSAGFRG